MALFNALIHGLISPQNASLYQAPGIKDDLFRLFFECSEIAKTGNVGTADLHRCQKLSVNECAFDMDNGANNGADLMTVLDMLA